VLGIESVRAEDEFRFCLCAEDHPLATHDLTPELFATERFRCSTMDCLRDQRSFGVANHTGRPYA